MTDRYCRLYLPGGVKIRQVRDVIGILAGLPVRRVEKPTPAIWIKVVGVYEENTTQVGFAKIKLAGQMVDGEEKHEVYYDFETPSGEKKISVKSSPFWQAICRRLVEFFGGRLDLNDIEGEGDDIVVEPRERTLEELNLELLNLRPLTEDEL